MKSQRKEIVGLLEKNDDTLPAGWKVVELGSVLAAQPDGKLVHQGWSPQCDREPAGEDEWGVLKTTAIQDGYFLEYENKRLPLNKEPRERIEVRDGDLLLTNAGPRKRCGVICYVREVRKKLMLSGKMYRLRFPDGEIYPKYMEFWLRTSSTQNEINDRKTGINESGLNLTQARFLTLPVMLLPIAEQKIIAEKLDTLLAQVDTTKARLERIPEILKTFRQSVLAAAVSGKLTEEWRDDNQPSWSSIKLGDIAEFVTSGSRGWAKFYSDTGSIFIRSQDINTDELVLNDPCYVNLPKNTEGTRTKVKLDDLLITITGANVTKCARVKFAPNDAYISQHVAMIRLTDTSSANFVELALKSIKSGRKQLTEMAYGGGKPGLNLQNIKDVYFDIPEQIEQTEIVRRVEELFAFADSIEQKTNSALERVNNLTQSILAKAFRGELTADWRSENPDLISGENSAEALLAKIQAEREKLALEKKAANKTRKKKA